MGKLTELAAGIERLREPPPKAPEPEPDPGPVFGEGELEWLVAEMLQKSLDKIAAEVGKGHGEALKVLGGQIKSLTTEMMKSNQTANNNNTVALEKILKDTRKAMTPQSPPKIPAPIVNVTVPREESTSWLFDIERDNRGFLKSVKASPVQAQ